MPDDLPKDAGECWILLGMMGSGKSTIGKILADRSGRRHIDTDRLLEQKLASTIPRIFKAYGEQAFRDHETSILRSLQRCGAVVSTGGGIILRDENWAEMHRLGRTIYLQLDWSLLCQRLDKSRRRRPLLQLENWREQVKALLEDREKLYLRADIVVPVDDEDTQAVASRILGMLAQ